MNYTLGSRIMNSIHVTCIKAGAFKSTVFIIYVLQARHVLEIEALAWQCKPTATQSFRKKCFTSPAICLSRFNPQIWRSLLWDLCRFTLLQICMFVPCFPDYSKGTSFEKKSLQRDFYLALLYRLWVSCKKKARQEKFKLWWQTWAIAWRQTRPDTSVQACYVIKRSESDYGNGNKKTLSAFRREIYICLNAFMQIPSDFINTFMWTIYSCRFEHSNHSRWELARFIRAQIAPNLCSRP